MSKLIVEMEYPKNGCSECRLKYKKRGYGGIFYCFNHLCVDKWTYGRTQNGDRPSWCPICGVLSEEHGDLVDKETAKNAFDSSFLTFRMKDGETMRGFYKRTIDELPVLIAAERKDDGTTVD